MSLLSSFRSIKGVNILRDVGGANGASGEDALGRSYVFTVDTLLKMLGVSLRLQVTKTLSSAFFHPDSH